MTTTKVYVVYYSLHRHVETMAKEVQDRGWGTSTILYQVSFDLIGTIQVRETLSNTILQKVKDPPRANDVVEIRLEQLLEAALVGKPTGVFWSIGFHGGGQELTALTAITQLAHHGMLFVPLGYTFGSGMFEMNEVKGGSAYGAVTFAADGSHQPTELELQKAFYQGKYVSEITKKLKNQPLSS
ncbi:hypothetical protein ACB098_08G027800 [Castanea mollissima]